MNCLGRVPCELSGIPVLSRARLANRGDMLGFIGDSFLSRNRAGQETPNGKKLKSQRKEADAPESPRTERKVHDQDSSVRRSLSREVPKAADGDRRSSFPPGGLTLSSLAKDNPCNPEKEWRGSLGGGKGVLSRAWFTVAAVSVTKLRRRVCEKAASFWGWNGREAK